MRGIAIVCLAACGDSGANIEVRSPDVDIDSVELFVAPSQCARMDGSPCASGVAWATSLQTQPAGDIFLLSDTAALTAPAKNGTATIRLEGVVNENQIARIAVVGISQGKAVAAGVLAPDITIPLGHQEVWQVDLVAVPDVGQGDPDGPPDPSGSQARMHMWSSDRRAAGLADCVMFQHWNGMAWDREYLVPPMDRDCDGEMVECNNYWFDFNLNGTATACMTTVGPLDPGICTFGTALCADGTSGSTACKQSLTEICAGDLLCANCTTDPSIDVTCIMQQISDAFGNAGSGGVIPFADCSFVPDVASVGQPCTVANSNQLLLDLSPIGAPCTSVEIRPLAIPLAAPLTALTAGTAMITAHLDQTSCSVTLTWGAGMAPMADTPAPFFLDITYPNTKHVLLPLRVRFQEPNVCPPVLGTYGCDVIGNDMSFLCSAG